MAQQGWIKVHRKLTECYIWESDEPFDKRSAWIDLLLNANHADKKTLIGNKPVIVERGHFITSEVKLSERWKWDRGKVRRFLNMLDGDGMITRSVTSRLYIEIGIMNYDAYQSKDNTTSENVENTSVEGTDTTSNEQEESKSSTSNEHVTNINKNDKNIKNDKKLYIPYDEIVNYLNEKAGTQYKSTTKKTKELIHTRYNEKFTLDDFKKVVDKKCVEWKGSDMEKFLRPETLFGTKFESYLNQQVSTGSKIIKDKFGNYEQRDYSKQEIKSLESQLLGWDGK